MRQINAGKKYMHFKGNEYEVIDIAIHSETKEKYVVYRALYDDEKIYVRPNDKIASEEDKNK